MKYLYLLLLLIPTLLHAQVPDVLPGTFKLAVPYPEAGKTITLIYQPKKHVPVSDPPNILVHFSGLPSAAFFQDELCYQMEYRQKQWVCNIKLPRATVAFYVRLYNGDTETDEWPMVFQSLIYRNKKPVEHAYGNMARNLLYVLRWDTVKTTKGVKAIEWYLKEITIYPKTHYKPWIGPVERIMDTSLIIKKIARIKQVKLETAWMFAHDLLRSIGRWPDAVKLAKEISVRFPQGIVNRDSLRFAYYWERDAVKAKLLLKEIGRFFPKDTLHDKELWHTYKATEDLSTSNFEAHDAELKNFKLSGLWAANVASAGYNWIQNGVRLDKAEQYTKEALDVIMADSALDSSDINREWFHKTRTRLVENLFNISMKLNKPAKGLAYLDKAPQTTMLEKLMYNYLQLQALVMMDKKSALDTAEKYIKNGELFPDTSVHKLLKPIYLQWRGTPATYPTDSGMWAAEFDKRWRKREEREKIDKAKASVVKDMIDRPAPNFTLKDLNGTAVTLSQFQGKNVIIAFDATWDGIYEWSPLAGVETILKERDDVVCLYVDTFNKRDKGHAELKKKIAEGHYTFPFLIDDQNNSVAKAYQAQGLPARVVIDKAGRIRFWHNNLSAPTATYELQAIVELLR